MQFGAAEGRAPSASFPSYDSFDHETYLNANADLQAAGITTKQAAYEHFVKFGQFEGRAGAPSVDQGIPGETYRLSPAADTWTGTDNNDTIDALTVDATGAVASTLTAFDKLDGGKGVDTLNIYSNGTQNIRLADTTTIKNVEIININNASATTFTTDGTNVDASRFEGATEIWQAGFAAGVTKLGAGQLAGFRTLSGNVSAAAATGVDTVNVALDGFLDSTAAPAAASTISVSGDKLSKVNVAGTVKDGGDVNTTVDRIGLTTTVGKDVESLTLASEVGVDLEVLTDPTSTKAFSKLDAAESKGAIEFDGTSSDGVSTSYKVATVLTGSGDDQVTLIADTNAASGAVAAVGATVSTGAGKDQITVDTANAALASTTGTTTVDAGDGDDTVTISSRSSGKLTVNLGAGDDTISGADSVSATDVIDGGDGVDTLMLSMVGASNVGAFTNFEVFDAKNLAKELDVSILAAKNTVTEFVASGDVGNNAELTNLGAGVGYRVIGDTAIANEMTLTQKVAGALTITLDIDETGTTAQTTTATDRDASVVADNATSIRAVFDSSFVGEATGATDNATDLDITGSAATSLEVVSGGANATNNLDYVYGKGAATAGPDGLLKTVTVSGDQAISLNFSDGTDDTESVIETVNASALTGALTFNTSDLKASSAANAFDGGVVTLGAGDDVITITSGASIANIGKGSEKGAATQKAFDVVSLGSAVARAADADAAAVSIKDGKLVFKGAGPATLSEAIGEADNALTALGDAVVFEFGSDSYIFINNDGGTDTVVKLVGTTNLNGLDEVGTSDQLYVF